MLHLVQYTTNAVMRIHASKNVNTVAIAAALLHGISIKHLCVSTCDLVVSQRRWQEGPFVVGRLA